MPDKPAEELEKQARKFLAKWDSDHNASCYTDVAMLTEFARATAQAIERMLRERSHQLILLHKNYRVADALLELADHIKKEYGL